MRFLPGMLTLVAISLTAAAVEKPNFVIIYTDDQGYSDTGLYGAKGFETPHLDAMANEGLRFSSFYSMANLCSPARAALLTGCYPVRAGIPNVLGPTKRRPEHGAVGLHPDELTLAELLKTKGYATACFGKWHLGDIPEFLPQNQGFDEFYGIPYSNDMWPRHPTATGYPDLPVYDGPDIVEVNPDQDSLTTRLTEKAVDFIKRHSGKPFFLYLPHPQPHVPLGVSDKFRGKSEQGLYGDVIMEIDWSVGQVLETLRSEGIDENTMVVFTSDNGPWLSYGNHAGSARPLREGKGTTWEGGHRVPCIVRWPGRIPPGQVSKTMVGNFDFFPTIAAKAGASIPDDRVIDGKDIWPILAGTREDSPHEYLYFYLRNEVQAIRKGPWKLHLEHQYRTLQAQPGIDGIPGPYERKMTPLALYNLDDNVGEDKDQSEEYPALVAEIVAAAEAFEKRILAEKRPTGTKPADPNGG